MPTTFPSVADASQVTIDWAEEATFNTPPTGTYQRVRIVDETLGGDPEVQESDEIDPDRQTSDQIRVGEQAGGDVQVQYSYGSHDEWLRYGAMSTGWTGRQTQPPGTIQVLADTPSAGLTTFRISSGTWTGFNVNQICWMNQFTNATNNGFWKIQANSTTDLVCHGTGVNEAADTRTVTQCTQILTGSELNSMSIIRRYQNLTEANGTSQLSGMCLAGFSMESAKRDKVRGAFNFLGSQEQSITSSPASGVDPVTTGRIFSVTEDLVTFTVNHVRSQRMSAFRFDYQNGLYVIDPAGVLYPDSIGVGQATATGSFDFFYESPTVFQLAEAFTDIHFMIGFQDANDNAMGFEILRASGTGRRRNPGGKNQAAQANISWAAAKDTSEDITIRMFRNGV